VQTIFGKEIARKLRQARDLMTHNGSHWVQGSLYDDARQAYCSIGAIRKVTTGDPYLVNPDEERQLTEALLPFLVFAEGQAIPLDSRDRVVKWNDESGRTWAEVSNAFEAAAREMEAS
jgi:hypothetical protein